MQTEETPAWFANYKVTIFIRRLSAAKSAGFRVYSVNPLAAAVEAMSKSAKRVRLDCPALRTAANIRP